MADLPSTPRDAEALRRSIGILETRKALVETDLATVDRAISRLVTEARQLGHAGPLPVPEMRRPHQGVILVFHRVAALDPDPFGLCVAPDVFREQMEYVARACQPMTLDALAAAAADGQIPDRAVAITLDDGYADAMAASDVMCDLHLPATFFVNGTTGDETFHDSLTRIFLEPHPLPAELYTTVAGATIRESYRGTDARRSAFDAVGSAGLRMSADQRRELLAALSLWSGVDLTARPTHRVLSAEELRELANRPDHEIGAHTTNHLFLPAHPRSVKVHEIESNRAALATQIGRDVVSFAYPYGAVDGETVQICQDAGFRNAVIVWGFPVRPWAEPRLLLPRVEAGRQGGVTFESTLRDAFALPIDKRSIAD